MSGGVDAALPADWLVPDWPAPAGVQALCTTRAGVYQDDYLALWNGFVQEATRTLTSDMDYQLHDALALLRRECHVAD